MHRTLVSGFLLNARCMLWPYGEVHVSHKTTPPFCHWNIPELASLNSLTLIDCTNFRIEDFPGYNNKRGAGSRCDEPFPLGKCSTFKFRVTPPVLKMSEARNQKTTSGVIPQSLEMIPIHIPGNWSSFDWQPSPSHPAYANNLPVHIGAQLHVNIENECFKIFGEYLNHSELTFGRTDYDVACYTRESLELGFARYMSVDSGRSPNGYINILEKLHHLSILRREWLLSLLLAHNQQNEFPQVPSNSFGQY